MKNYKLQKKREIDEYMAKVASRKSPLEAKIKELEENSPERKYLEKLQEEKNRVKIAFENAIKQTNRYQELINDGKTPKEASEIINKEFKNVTDRASAVNRLCELGFTKEFAESAIPENFDQEKAIVEKNAVDAIETKYNNYKNNLFNIPRNNS